MLWCNASWTRASAPEGLGFTDALCFPMKTSLAPKMPPGTYVQATALCPPFPVMITAAPTPPQMEIPKTTLETWTHKCRCLGPDPNPPKDGYMCASVCS